MFTEQNLATMSAVEMTARFADRTVSPVEVHDAVQSVIEAREGVLNAFWVRDPAESRKAAEASEARWAAGEPLGPIDGVPVTLKENIARRGVPMPSGNAGVEPVVPDRDAPITERVLESGGSVLGSTVMPDWGMLSSGVSEAGTASPAVPGTRPGRPAVRAPVRARRPRAGTGRCTSARTSAARSGFQERGWAWPPSSRVTAESPWTPRTWGAWRVPWRARSRICPCSWGS